MTSVSITHNSATKQTFIDVDGVRQERVISYSLTQEPLRHPVVEIVWHDGTVDGDRMREFSRTFVPTKLTLDTI